MSGQARLVGELYSQGQASMVWPGTGWYSQSSLGPSKFLEVVPPASRSTSNPFKPFLLIYYSWTPVSSLHDSQLKK